jgi:hypothetical protein
MRSPGSGEGTVMATPNAAAAPIVPAPSRWRAILIVLLINAVPIVGVWYYDWSATNVFVLYWFENLLVAITTTLRIFAHRELTRKRGHWRVDESAGVTVNDKKLKTTLLGSYSLVAFVFTLAHGIFVFAIAFMLNRDHPDDPRWLFSLPQLERGVAIIAAMLGVELVVDLATIRTKSFAWIKAYADRRTGRVFVLHLAIIFGMLAMAMTNSPFGILYVLIGLKTLVDLGSVMGEGAKAPDAETPPPAWALKFADKLGKDKGGAAMMQKEWKAESERTRREAIENEEVMR